MNTRDIFKQNLNYYIGLSGKNKKMISEEMQIPYTTLVDWVNGNKFPRADGIERLADYFKILKSDLLEEKEKPTTSTVTDNDIKIALFGGDSEITDSMLEEVRQFARYIQDRKNRGDG